MRDYPCTPNFYVERLPLRGVGVNCRKNLVLIRMAAEYFIRVVRREQHYNRPFCLGGNFRSASKHVPEAVNSPGRNDRTRTTEIDAHENEIPSDHSDVRELAGGGIRRVQAMGSAPDQGVCCV